MMSDALISDAAINAAIDALSCLLEDCQTERAAVRKALKTAHTTTTTDVIELRVKTVSKFEGTPGPWAVGGGHDFFQVGTADAPDSRPCIVFWTGFDSSERPIKEQYANARLIAAAPDLLEAVTATLTDCADLLPDHYFELLATAKELAEGSS